MAAIARSLTSFSSSAGCGCKLPPGTLLSLVRSLSEPADPRVLVASHTGDDAAVVQLRDDLAVVQTVDFFTPVVDDPYDFGRIAATNALSDIYAMGAEPLCALNLVAFPIDHLGVDVLSEILRGGEAVVEAAGASVVGGHSIDDPEPKYGLAVTGTIDPRHVLTNGGGQAGDALVLTKPLGVGAIIAGRKSGASSDELIASAVETMTTLNAAAASAARAAEAHAMTDVTGFGLLGHLHSLASESGLAAELDVASVPALEGVEQLLCDGGGVSGGTRRNAEFSSTFTQITSRVPNWRRWLLCDATTSGGLLVALAPEQANAVPGTIIGRLVDGPPGLIQAD